VRFGDSHHLRRQGNLLFIQWTNGNAQLLNKPRSLIYRQSFTRKVIVKFDLIDDGYKAVALHGSVVTLETFSLVYTLFCGATYKAVSFQVLL
jgi:hypothetical protein